MYFYISVQENHLTEQTGVNLASLFTATRQHERVLAALRQCAAVWLFLVMYTLRETPTLNSLNIL